MPKIYTTFIASLLLHLVSCDSPESKQTQSNPPKEAIATDSHTTDSTQKEAPKERFTDTLFDAYGNIIRIRSLKAIDSTTPEPLDGMDAFRKFIKANLIYPKKAKMVKVEGTVAVMLRVKADSTLGIFAVDGLGHGTEEEAVRVIMAAGDKWIPGVDRETGEPVASTILVPVLFELAENLNNP